MFDNLDDPKQQMLMAIAMGLLGGQGGKGLGGFGRDLGQAGLLGMNQYSQATNQQQKMAAQKQEQEMRAMQLDQLRRGNQMQARTDQAFSTMPDYSKPILPDMSPTVENAQKLAAAPQPTPADIALLRAQYLDSKGLTEAADKYYSRAKALEPKFHVVGEGGALVGEPARPGMPSAPIFQSQPKAPPGFSRDASGKLTVDPNWLNAETQLRQAGAMRVTNNINSFTPASEEAQKKFMDSTRVTFDQLKQAPVALDSIEKAKALVPAASGFVGSGAEPLLGAVKFLNNRLGMSINTEGVKSAEELRTRIFFNVMDNLKKMDAQPSEMQQRMMMEALGSLGTDPGALPKVLDAFGDSIRGKVQLHNQEVAGAVQRGVKFPYNPMIDITTKSSGSRGIQNSPSNATPTIDDLANEILRRRGAR